MYTSEKGIFLEGRVGEHGWGWVWKLKKQPRARWSWRPGGSPFPHGTFPCPALCASFCPSVGLAPFFQRRLASFFSSPDRWSQGLFFPPVTVGSWWSDHLEWNTLYNVFWLILWSIVPYLWFLISTFISNVKITICWSPSWMLEIFWSREKKIHFRTLKVAGPPQLAGYMGVRNDGVITWPLTHCCTHLLRAIFSLSQSAPQVSQGSWRTRSDTADTTRRVVCYNLNQHHPWMALGLSCDGHAG